MEEPPEMPKAGGMPEQSTSFENPSFVHYVDMNQGDSDSDDDDEIDVDVRLAKLLVTLSVFFLVFLNSSLLSLSLLSLSFLVMCLPNI